MNDTITIREESIRGERVTVRAWRPGDGLTCSSAAKLKDPAMRCGVPVAVIVSQQATGPGGRLKTVGRIACAIHLAGQFGFSRGETRVRAEKAARELVIANHWDEYQKALDDACDAAEVELLAQIPDEVRALIQRESDGEAA